MKLHSHALELVPDKVISALPTVAERDTAIAAQAAFG